MRRTVIERTLHRQFGSSGQKPDKKQSCISLKAYREAAMSEEKVVSLAGYRARRANEAFVDVSLGPDDKVWDGFDRLLREEESRTGERLTGAAFLEKMFAVWRDEVTLRLVECRLTAEERAIFRLSTDESGLSETDSWKLYAYLKIHVFAGKSPWDKWPRSR